MFNLDQVPRLPRYVGVWVSALAQWRRRRRGWVWAAGRKKRMLLAALLACGSLSWSLVQVAEVKEVLMVLSVTLTGGDGNKVCLWISLHFSLCVRVCLSYALYLLFVCVYTYTFCCSWSLATWRCQHPRTSNIAKGNVVVREHCHPFPQLPSNSVRTL